MSKRLVEVATIKQNRSNKIWSFLFTLVKTNLLTPIRVCADNQCCSHSFIQVVDSESLKCLSCNRHGQFTCLKCKVCFCDDHVRRKGVK